MNYLKQITFYQKVLNYNLASYNSDEIGIRAKAEKIAGRDGPGNE